MHPRPILCFQIDQNISTRMLYLGFYVGVLTVLLIQGKALLAPASQKVFPSPGTNRGEKSINIKGRGRKEGGKDGRSLSLSVSIVESAIAFTRFGNCPSRCLSRPSNARELSSPFPVPSGTTQRRALVILTELIFSPNSKPPGTRKKVQYSKGLQCVKLSILMVFGDCL